MVHAYLPVICHLHIRQSGWDLLHATAVTLGGTDISIMSQHRKLTLEKKMLLLGCEPVSFQSRVWRSDH